MIRVSAILLIGLVASAALRRQSAAVRHWVMASAIACAALVPLVQGIAPEWQIPMTAFGRPSAAVATAAARAEWLTDGQPLASETTTERLSGATASAALRLIWLAGVLVSLSLLLVGLTRLAWMTRRSRLVVDGIWSDIASGLSDRLKPRSSIRLLQTDHPALLVTWGLARPNVLLPGTARQWPADRIRAVLSHELAHVERRDWAIQMAAELVRCVYWFNPLIWMACRRLRLESEKACDDAVLRMGMSASEYAAHLLDVARAFRITRSSRSVFPAPAMARPSHLERRVRVMLNTTLNHAPLTRLAATAITVAWIAVMIPIAGLAAATESTQTAATWPSAATAVQSVAGDRMLTADGSTTLPDSVAAVANVRPRAQRVGSSPEPAAATSRTAQQAASAEYSGILRDPAKRPMSGAVSLINSATGRRIEFKLNESGEFSANGLPAGEYQIEARKPGFMTIRKTFVLAAGQQRREDLVAQIGSLSEKITVQRGGTAAANAAPAAPRQLAKTLPPEADPCSQSTNGGCLTPPAKLLHVNPVFPTAHATDGASGTVVLEGRVGTDGFLKDLRAKSGADPAFAASALEAVQQWQFSPVKLNGTPLECRIEVTVRFVAGE